MQIFDTSHIARFPKEVELGFASISDTFSPDILNCSERNTFNSFRDTGRKDEFLTSRHLFRFMLNALGFEAKDIGILKEEGGKPYALDGTERLYVSFSHSRNMVFCAISHDLDIGVDAEILSRHVPQEILNRVLTQSEKVSLNDLDPLTIWTLKEAAVKCLGTGLRTNLNEVQVVKDKSGDISARFNNDNLIEICSFRATDHQIALAYQNKPL